MANGDRRSRVLAGAAAGCWMETRRATRTGYDVYPTLLRSLLLFVVEGRSSRSTSDVSGSMGKDSIWC